MLCLLNFKTRVDNSSRYSTYYPGSLNRSSIVPVPDFDQKIGDLTFILLSNVAGYTDPVEDTWFKATTRGDAALGLEYMFLPDDPIVSNPQIQWLRLY